MKLVRKNFDYEYFANYAVNEAKKYLPQSMSEEDKNSILKSFEESALKTGKVLSGDKSLNLDDEKKIKTMARCILEWIFKALVAFQESGIPLECRHGFMLDVGFVAFDIANTMNTMLNISDTQIKQTIEYHVINKIQKLLTEFQLSGIITKEIKEKFLNHPYIDKSNQRIQFAIYS